MTAAEKSMNWQHLIIWVLHQGDRETAARWYRWAKEAGAQLDDEKIRKAAEEAAKQ